MYPKEHALCILSSAKLTVWVGVFLFWSFGTWFLVWRLKSDLQTFFSWQILYLCSPLLFHSIAICYSSLCFSLHIHSCTVSTWFLFKHQLHFSVQWCTHTHTKNLVFLSLGGKEFYENQTDTQVHVNGIIFLFIFLF